jgi:type II secretory pathway pseudopilin PulG
MKRSPAFTLVELLIASAVLLAVLLSGVTVSRSAMTVAGDSVRTGAAEHRAQRAQELIQQYLLPAGRSTLEATPAGGAAEPMQDGVSYDNVSFRQAVAATREGVTYDPDPSAPPDALAFQPRFGGSEGDLILTTESGSHPICGGVRTVEFIRSGSAITVRVITAVRGTVPDTCVLLRRLVLRNE